MTKKALTLSIVIPVYDEERYLKACLDSISNQAEMPDEVIVVDNNSTDQSVAIAQQYSFVKVLKEPKQGIFYARNSGFNAVKNEIIGRIDADTRLSKNWVSKVRQFYGQPENRNRGLTGGGHFLNIRAPGFHSWLFSLMTYRVNRLLLGHYILWGSNSVFPTRLWQKVKKQVCDRADIHEDLDLSIHLHQLGIPIHYDPNLKVGVIMKRVRSRRRELLQNMLMWPKTLKVHGNKNWIFGLIGAIMLWAFWPVPILAEKLSQLFGKPELRD